MVLCATPDQPGVPTPVSIWFQSMLILNGHCQTMIPRRPTTQVILLKMKTLLVWQIRETIDLPTRYQWKPSALLREVFAAPIAEVPSLPS